MADRTLKAILEADDRASPILGKFAGNIDGLAKQAAAAVAGFVGFQAGKDALIACTQAAMESERAIAKLSQAVRQSGQNYNDAMPRLNALADATAKLTIYDDEAARGAMRLLTSVGKLSAQGMEPALRAAVNLAAGLEMDLQTAAMLVAKAAAGSTETLSRYGIILDEATPKGEKFAEVLQLINDKWGGQAQAEAATYAGQIKRISNAFGELMEAAGRGVTGGPGVTGPGMWLLEGLTRQLDMQVAKYNAVWAALNHYGAPLPANQTFPWMPSATWHPDYAAGLAIYEREEEWKKGEKDRAARRRDIYQWGQGVSSPYFTEVSDFMAELNQQALEEAIRKFQANAMPTSVARERLGLPPGELTPVKGWDSATPRFRTEWDDFEEMGAQAIGALGGEIVRQAARGELSFRKLGNMMIEMVAQILAEMAAKQIMAAIVSTAAIAAAASEGMVVPMYAAAGGFVPRGEDRVPAMLSPGEIVVPAAASKQILQGKAVLSGRGSAGGSQPLIVNISAIDGASVRALWRNHPREMAEGLRHLAARNVLGG